MNHFSGLSYSMRFTLCFSWLFFYVFFYILESGGRLIVSHPCVLSFYFYFHSHTRLSLSQNETCHVTLLTCPPKICYLWNLEPEISSQTDHDLYVDD